MPGIQRCKFDDISAEAEKKPIGGSYQSMAKPVQTPTTNSSSVVVAGSPGSPIGPGPGELRKATSQISITQLSGINVNIRCENLANMKL